MLKRVQHLIGLFALVALTAVTACQQRQEVEEGMEGDTLTVEDTDVVPPPPTEDTLSEHDTLGETIP